MLTVFNLAVLGSGEHQKSVFENTNKSLLESQELWFSLREAAQDTMVTAGCAHGCRMKEGIVCLV